MFDPIRAQAMIREAQQNPAKCQSILATLSRQLGDGQHPSRKRDRRSGAGLIIRAPDPGAIATGASSSIQTVTWRKKGRVLDLYGQVTSALDTDAAFLSVQILDGGQKSLVSNGDAATFAPYFALFGKTQNWFPLDVEVEDGNVWTFQWKNEGSGGNITPSLLLAFQPYP